MTACVGRCARSASATREDFTRQVEKPVPRGDCKQMKPCGVQHFRRTGRERQQSKAGLVCGSGASPLLGAELLLVCSCQYRVWSWGSWGQMGVSISNKRPGSAIRPGPPFERQRFSHKVETGHAQPGPQKPGSSLTVKGSTVRSRSPALM